MDRRELKSRNLGSGTWNMMLPMNYRYFNRMAVTERTSSNGAFIQSWSASTGVSLSIPTVRQRFLRHWLHALTPFYRISPALNHQWFRLQCSHRAISILMAKVILSDESHYSLDYNDGHTEDSSDTTEVNDFSRWVFFNIIPERCGLGNYWISYTITPSPNFRDSK